jgi:hypothetical protein
MLSMVFLLSQPLAAAHDQDAVRAGLQTRPAPRSLPQRSALIGRVLGRRAGCSAAHAAHA